MVLYCHSPKFPRSHVSRDLHSQDPIIPESFVLQFYICAPTGYQYVPEALCSHSPNFTSSYVPCVPCSQGPILPGSFVLQFYKCGFPGFLVYSWGLSVLFSQGPKFSSSYVPGVLCFYGPILPGFRAPKTFYSQGSMFSRSMYLFCHGPRMFLKSCVSRILFFCSPKLEVLCFQVLMFPSSRVKVRVMVI